MKEASIFTQHAATQFTKIPVPWSATSFRAEDRHFGDRPSIQNLRWVSVAILVAANHCLCEMLWTAQLCSDMPGNNMTMTRTDEQFELPRNIGRLIHTIGSNLL
jgi:hypothetical protein